MLTKRQNMLEVIRGGNPDRFVKQYEGLTFVLNTPYQTQYPMMPEGPGAPTVKCGWGYYNSWPAGTPGAFPLHDPEHLVCPDVAEWKKYVKAPDINYTAEDWKECQETGKNARRQLPELTGMKPWLLQWSHREFLRCAIISVRSRIL